MVSDFVGKLGRCVIDEAAPEGCRVVIAHVCADGDACFCGRLEGARDGVRVAGVEAGGDVGGGDKLEHRGVIGNGVAGGGFAEVSVEVYVQRAHIRRTPLL